MKRVALVVTVLALLGAPSAGASTPFGPDLSTGEAGSLVECGLFTFSASPAKTIDEQCNSVLLQAGGASAAAPVSGVLVEFKVRMSAAAAGHLRLMHNPGGDLETGPLVYAGLGPDITVPGDGATHAFPVRLPITAGDLLAFGTPAKFVERAAPAGSGGTRVVTDTADGTSPSEAMLGAATSHAIQAPISGVIEPDADGDGFGDETQDRCPGAAGATGGCPPAGPPAGPPAVSNTLTMPKASVRKGEHTTLTVQVEGLAGTLEASGKGIKPVSLQVVKSGSYKIPIKPTKKTKERVKARGSAKVTVQVTYKPAGADPVSLAKKVKLIR